MEILYDSIQEGDWFRKLHPKINGAAMAPFPRNPTNEKIARVLSYDRPDIVLVDNNLPILVLERTREVPSGHNVGQRFARLVAAAQMQVPSVYFGPYKAFKHGNDTAGPRYMNLRLFYAIKKMAEIEKSAITSINWIVDENCELIQTPEKDVKVKEYLKLFFNLYDAYGPDAVGEHLIKSDFEKEQEVERSKFIQADVRDPEQYNIPPESVILGTWKNVSEISKYAQANEKNDQILFYKVGMNYIRSDPYAGAALLYAYLYCGGMRERTRKLILHFPNIPHADWQALAHSNRKDIRLFRLVADAILFKDGFVMQANL